MFAKVNLVQEYLGQHLNVEHCECAYDALLKLDELTWKPNTVQVHHVDGRRETMTIEQFREWVTTPDE